VIRGTGTVAAAALLMLGIGQVMVLCAQEPESQDDGPPAEHSDEAVRERGKPFWESLPFDLRGFWEVRGGVRTGEDKHQSEDATLAETRLQLEVSEWPEWGQFRLKTDFLYDAVLEEATLDLREASVLVTPFTFADFKIGRQVLTWGTGDYIFINDLFPKDWESFLIGRDDEYLKAPSDAVKASFYTHVFNLDLVYMPRFNPDRFIDGERLSYFNPQLGRRAGEDARIRTRGRDEWFDDSETAMRLYNSIGGYEVALYAYDGFWKSPVGFDPERGKAAFPRLTGFGASARGRLWKGIGNVELGYYDSHDDRSGNDPFVPNSQLRFLAAYEQEVAKDFTVGGQYYLEHMLDYGAYLRGLPAGSAGTDEDRHVVTVRLTKLAMYQNLKLSLFTLYSPSDRDAYLRPNVRYRINDRWSIEGGANVFLGKEQHTFFGQFQDNTNVYFGARCSF